MTSTSKGPIFRKQWCVRLAGSATNILYWDTLEEAEADAEKVAELHPGIAVLVYELVQVRYKP